LHWQINMAKSSLFAWILLQAISHSQLVIPAALCVLTLMTASNVKYHRPDRRSRKDLFKDSSLSQSQV
jgi:hypothetical protein